jgi:hypothetical protein
MLYLIDMRPKSQSDGFVEMICKLLRITVIPNWIITILLAVCGAVQARFIEHSRSFDNGIDAAKRLEYHNYKTKDRDICLRRPAGNPEVKTQEQSIHLFSKSQGVIVLERI